jgi:hypothetical protein
MIDPLGLDQHDSKGAKAPAREAGSYSLEPEVETGARSPSHGDAELGWGPRPVPETSTAQTSLMRPIARHNKLSALQRVLGAARAALPVVQKILPLLDGNIASVAASFMVPQQHAVDLEPVKTALGKLQIDLRQVRGQVTDQHTVVVAVEQDLAALKESVERNALEQRELMEGILGFKRRINRLAWMLLVMVVVSIAFTAMVCVRLAYLLRM